MSSKKKERLKEVRFGGTTPVRIDRFLVENFPDFSRMFFKKLINARAVTVDGHPVSPHHSLRNGQSVQIAWPEKSRPKKPPADAPLPFPIVFEDEIIMIINKPPNLLVHPAGGKWNGDTLVELLLPRLDESEWPDDMRPGLIHRLDKDTSGVLVFAKTPEAHAKIAKQFLKRRVKKTYQALIWKAPKLKKGRLESKMARDPRFRQRFAVTDQGRDAITDFKILDNFDGKAAHVELYPKTGRTHQLRVQLAHFGHPILGDKTYGGAREGFAFVPRQMLHAAHLEFTHPGTNEDVSFSADLPEDFLSVLSRLKKSP